MAILIRRLVKIFIIVLLIGMIISMPIDYCGLQSDRLSMVIAGSEIKIANENTVNQNILKRVKKEKQYSKSKLKESVVKKVKKNNEDKVWVSKKVKNKKITYDQKIAGNDKENTAENEIINLLTEIANKTDKNVQKSEKVSICGLSMGNIPYVILSNGKKVFEGGRLYNQCIIEEIDADCVIVNCNGLKRKIVL